MKKNKIRETLNDTREKGKNTSPCDRMGAWTI